MLVSSGIENTDKDKAQDGFSASSLVAEGDFEEEPENAKPRSVVIWKYNQKAPEAWYLGRLLVIAVRRECR